MYLHTITFSNITNTYGDLFKKTCTLNLTPQRSSMTCPKIPNPPKSAWNLWRRALRWAYHSDTSPIKELGSWFPNSSQILHETLWHPITNTIYLCNQSSYQLHVQKENNSNRYIPTDQYAPPPSDSTPCTVHFSCFVMRRYFHLHAPSKIQSPTNLDSFPTVPVLNKDEVENIWEAMENGTLTISCDGSLKGQLSSYAVCIHLNDNKNDIMFGEPCNTIKSKISSLYPELCGSLAVSKTMKRVNTFMEKPSPLTTSILITRRLSKDSKNTTKHSLQLPFTISLWN